MTHEQLVWSLLVHAKLPLPIKYCTACSHKVEVVVSREQARVARATHATSTDPRGPSGARSVQHVQQLVVEVVQEVPKMWFLDDFGPHPN